MVDTLSSTGNQFQKIAKCVDEFKKNKNYDTIERIKRYAEQGFDYTNKKTKMIKSDDGAGTITPIENVITADHYFVYS